MPDGERRLAAILFTDIVGYTSLAQKDESSTLQALERHRSLLRPLFTSRGGREVKTIGDAFLVEFQSALDAVLCAAAIQQTMHDRKLATGETISLRIGIHVGDVVESGNDILGDAVNVASRIEPLAEPGGVCMTSQVYEQVRNKSDLPFISLGEKSLKNVNTPVTVYKVVMPWEKGAQPKVQSEMNRVAVLPFANMSPDPNDEYFADGMTEELIDRLAHVRGIEVIARTSVMSYKKKEKKVTEIAKELLVGSVVEGSVRKAGNRVRVTAQLVNGATEGHLWSEHYDGIIDDVFAVQSEIAEKVAKELKVLLASSERTAIQKKPTESTEAYGAFLRGRELYREGYEAPLRQALALFEQATELDPSFARAHVGVAECHQYLGALGYEPQDTMLSAVKESLKRALELDPDLPEAHASLSTLLFNQDDVPTAELEARRAIELDPSLPEPYFMLSDILMIKGEFDEAVRMMEAAYRLDPIRPVYIFTLGYLYLDSGREQEALEYMSKTERLSPGGTYRNMTDYYLSKGEMAKAREMHAKFEKLQPTHPWVTYMGGFMDAMAGDREKALAAIKKIEDANIGPVGYNFVAYVYCALGDMDRYFECLNRALEEHMLIPAVVSYSPLLAKAREDPRYDDLLQKLRKQSALTA